MLQAGIASAGALFDAKNPQKPSSFIDQAGP
jgi:hypothetical protein